MVIMEKKMETSIYRVKGRRAPSYLNSRLLGYVTIGYKVYRTQFPLFL